MQAWSLTSESKNPIDLYSHKCLRSTPLLNFRNEQLFRSQWISWVLLSVPELVLGSMVTAQGQAVQGRSGHQRTDYRPSHQTDPPTRHTLQAKRLRDNHTQQVKASPLFTGISIVCTPPDVFTLSGLSWLGIVRTACWGLDWLEWIFNNPKISWKIRPSWRSDASLKFLPSLAFTFSHSRMFLGHVLFP